jgi:hypothetical protein
MPRLFKVKEALQEKALKKQKLAMKITKKEGLALRQNPIW